MNRKAGVLLTGALLGVLAAGPLQGWSEASTGPATIRITDLELAVSRLDMGARGTSPGDTEIVRARLRERVTEVTIGRSELVCTFVDNARSRVCRGTYVLPLGTLVVGGSILYRRFYGLAILGGTGRYDNARGSLTVTRTATGPVRNLLVFRLVG